MGYKYIEVDEDEAANVVYANRTLLHLGNDQIPKGSAVTPLVTVIVSQFSDILDLMYTVSQKNAPSLTGYDFNTQLHIINFL